ncbi:SDR family NAD(P)-dependent oxidoreductase [Nocardia nova]|uniref:SDR family NAD(P)-dependent oxidoreductase n=1 Tax=Nocardia nova TaxID=37330 RepID=UPI0033CFF4A1
MSRFDDKVVFITGGVRGIGAAATDRFLAEGATVVAADISEETFEDFRKERAEAGDRLQVVTADVTDAASVESAVAAAVDRHGGIDATVANAGLALAGTILETSVEDWRKTFEVDVNGVFNTARAVLPYLIRRRGALVTTASICGIAGDFGIAAYSAAKGAVVNLTRSLAVDYGRHGVRVNAVAPGPVLTDRMAAFLAADASLRATFDERTPLGRIVTPHEVAATMAFLASGDASGISGVILPVDGGLTAWTGMPPTI